MDLNQVTLEAIDFDESLKFYQKIGMKLIVLSDGCYARFELPTGSSTLSIHHADQPVIGNTVLYFEVDDLNQRHGQLCELGVVFDTIPTNEGWRWKEARFRDPAGNKLCLLEAGLDRRFPPWRLKGGPDTSSES